MGEYQIERFPVVVKVSEKDGIYFMDITRTNIQSYLIPQTDTNYMSMDKNMEVEFMKEDENITGINVQLKAFGITLPGKKM